MRYQHPNRVDGNSFKPMMSRSQYRPGGSEHKQLRSARPDRSLTNMRVDQRERVNGAFYCFKNLDRMAIS